MANNMAAAKIGGSGYDSIDLGRQEDHRQSFFS